MPLARRSLRYLVPGSMAAIASALVLAWSGRRELGSAAAPMNGPSQWVWGRGAPYRDDASARHTLLGYAIHHVASLAWGLLFEGLRRRAPQDVPGTFAAAVTTTAIANVVDFQLTPDRLTPGFEKRLSHRALFCTYAAVAAGLFAGALLADRATSRAP
jgi:hypothetical protein